MMLRLLLSALLLVQRCTVLLLSLLPYVKYQSITNDVKMLSAGAGLYFYGCKKIAQDRAHDTAKNKVERHRCCTLLLAPSDPRMCGSRTVGGGKAICEQMESVCVSI